MQLCLICLFIGVFFLLPAADAATEEAPAFELKQTDKGGSVEITITANRLKDMYAFDFILAYDKKQLTFISSQTGLKGFAVSPIVEKNTVQIAFTNVGGVSGVNGKADLATLVFEKIGNAKTVVELKQIKLVDSKLALQTINIEAKVNIQLNTTFTDLAGHWAEASIFEAAKRGFVRGYTDGSFKPGREVTRAEFAVMLVNALGPKELNGAHPSFEDNVPVWAKTAIETVVSNKWMNGYPDGTFRPNAWITREEMAAVTIRSIHMNVVSEGRSEFADNNQIAAWARPYVVAAVEAGILKGKGNNRFAPKANATRAEAVTIILIALEQQTNK